MKAAKWREFSQDELQQKARELTEEIFNPGSSSRWGWRKTVAGWPGEEGSGAGHTVLREKKHRASLIGKNAVARRTAITFERGPLARQVLPRGRATALLRSSSPPGCLFSRSTVLARARSFFAWLSRDGFFATPIESWNLRLKISSVSSRAFCWSSSWEELTPLRRFHRSDLQG